MLYWCETHLMLSHGLYNVSMVVECLLSQEYKDNLRT